MYDALFEPFRLGRFTLPNRIVMAPMTRGFSHGGIPGPDVAEYYRRRAAGGVGLIITEGTWIEHPAASNDENAPRFYGEDALSGWRRVVDGVHAEGGRIMPQLWHTGLTRRPVAEHIYDAINEDLSRKVSPSGYVMPGEKVGEGMTEREIAEVIEAYARGAETAEKLGFDGIEIHGAHGYLVDQFFWHETNMRIDRYGQSLPGRATFAVEMIRACRARVSPDFPIVLRFSQWKLADYDGRLAYSPAELEGLLGPLSDAGVDIFHASQRRYWLPEFENSSLNLAGWAKKLTGKPSITVGSVGLSTDMTASLSSAEPSLVADIDGVVDMLDEGAVDLVAIGRALLSDPNWARKVQFGHLDQIQPFSRNDLAALT
ncbi:MAG: NADH:flavin oxidoreductase [Hyphomicrobiales bacterium]|nr:MAG: NADH:flavin oxidoreductase [Hyphomicrobiales bacterium]